VDHLTFAVSAALAQVLTNLDNLAVLLALLLTLGRARAVGGFVIAQAVVLAAAMGLAIGADQALSGWVGYLGIVPIALGLHALWQQSGVDEGAEGSVALPQGGLVAPTLLFLSMSLDSFAVMAPLLADSLPGYRFSALMGAVAAVLGIGVLSILLSQLATPSARWAGRLERLGPVTMILVGLYVLINSGTDTI
jgi:cadmium resistance protein CadD (predicted permease)